MASASTGSSVAARVGWSLLRRFGVGSSPRAAAATAEGDSVGMRRIPSTMVVIAGTVPIPVAVSMAGSDCCMNQRMVSLSDLCPSSRVSQRMVSQSNLSPELAPPPPSRRRLALLPTRWAAAPACPERRKEMRRLPRERDEEGREEGKEGEEADVDNPNMWAPRGSHADSAATKGPRVTSFV
ncbi:hypothetical protein EE612_023772 [Oryza sativa]|jgi:hypothetical protein|nr:hypothetical protein EE612_023772 [Oryza sativa]